MPGNRSPSMTDNPCCRTERSRAASLAFGTGSSARSAATTDVRERIVRTVGLLGGAADVPWIAERLRSPTVRRAALIALARIGTKPARAQLVRAQVKSTAEEGRWIEYLLSPAFGAGERKAGRR